MGLFGDLDVAAAEDNPWAVPANTYEATVFTVEVKADKNGNQGMILVYKIASGDHEGKTVSEWKTIPTPADPKHPTAEEMKAASYLKMRLTSLGVPETRINSVEIGDLEGIPVTITVTVNGEYTNVKRVEVRDDTAIAPQDFSGFGS